MALVGAMDYEPGKAVGSSSSSGRTQSKSTTTTSQKKSTSTQKSTPVEVLPGSGEIDLTGSALAPKPTGAATDNSLDIYSLYADYLSQQQAKAEASYQRNIQNINNAYNSARSYYDSNLASTRNTLKTSYDASKKDIDSDAEASLREAYINNMLNRKNLTQALTAQGLNGGASETTQASMLNNYGNARNNIETTQAKNLADLLRTYNDNLASAQNAWSSQMASLELQKMQQLQAAENALANMQTASLGNISTDSSYLTALSSLMKAQNAFEAAPTENPLLQNLYNITQADYQALADTSYQRYLQQQKLTEAEQTAAMIEALKNPVNQTARLYAL